MNSDDAGPAVNPHKQFVDTILQMMDVVRDRARATDIQQKEALSVARGSSKQQPGWQERPGVPEHSGVLSVFGGRGTGKTTLIRQVVEELRQNTCDLVLGPITPLDFRETRSLFSYVLAALQEAVFGEGPGGEEDCLLDRGNREEGRAQRERRALLFKQLQEVRNYVARTVPVSLKTLVQSGKLGEDFAYHFTTIQDRHLKARRQYPQLVADLPQCHHQDRHCAARSSHGPSGPQEPPLLVVVMDDCDLFPELIRTVLDDILRLCESPRVVVLFASNEEAIYRVVAEDMLDGKNTEMIRYMEGIGLTDPCHVREEVALYVHKVLPVSQCVWLTNATYDYQIRLSFTPLQADPNLAGFTEGGKPQPRPSLAQLMRRFHFTDSDHFSMPNLLALFDYSVIDEVNGATGTPEKEILYSPFCSLLPDTPRGLSYLHLFLARLYAELSKRPPAEGLSPGEVALDGQGGRELIKVMLNMARYGTVPKDYDALEGRLLWRTIAQRERLEMDASGAWWHLFRGGKTVKGWVNGGNMLPLEKDQDAPNLRLFVRQIKEAEVSLRSKDGRGDVQGIDAAKKEDESLCQAFSVGRWMEFVQTVVQGSGLESELVTRGKMPLPRLFPPRGLDRGGMVYAPLNSDASTEEEEEIQGDRLIIFPFWLDQPLPTYHVFYLYRRLWNDHVKVLDNYRNNKAEYDAELNRFNQSLLDYLALLHLHLVAVAFLWPSRRAGGAEPMAGMLPLATPIEDIGQEVRQRKDGLKRFLDFCERANPDQFGFPRGRTSQAEVWLPSIIEAHATFYLACALSTPMTSNDTTKWIMTSIIDRLKEREAGYKDKIAEHLLRTVIMGSYATVFETRPEGGALLRGIQYLTLATTIEDPDHKMAEILTGALETALGRWEEARKEYFPEMMPYPPPAERSDRLVNFAIARGGKEGSIVQRPFRIVKIDTKIKADEIMDRPSSPSGRDASGAGSKEQRPEEKSSRRQDAGDPDETPDAADITMKLLRHHMLLEMGKGDIDALLGLIRDIEIASYGEDERKRFAAIAGNCGVVLETRGAHGQAEQIYRRALEMYDHDGVHFQYADFLVDRGRLDEAATHVEQVRKINPGHRLVPVLTMKLSVKREVDGMRRASAGHRLQAGAATASGNIRTARSSDAQWSDEGTTSVSMPLGIRGVHYGGYAREGAGLAEEFADAMDSFKEFGGKIGLAGLSHTDVWHVMLLREIAGSSAFSAQEKKKFYWQKWKGWWQGFRGAETTSQGGKEGLRRETVALRVLADFLATVDEGRSRAKELARKLFLLLLRDHKEIMSAGDLAVVQHNLAALFADVRQREPALALWSQAYPALMKDERVQMGLIPVFMSINRLYLAEMVADGKDVPWETAGGIPDLLNKGRATLDSLTAKLEDIGTILREVRYEMTGEEGVIEGEVVTSGNSGEEEGKPSPVDPASPAEPQQEDTQAPGPESDGDDEGEKP